MNEVPTKEDEMRDKAIRRVDAIIGFRQHLLVYVIVNSFIFAVWLIVALIAGGDSWFPWFIFPLLGWGIGIVMHGWGVYAQTDRKREAMVTKEMERMTAGSQPPDDPGRT